MPTYDYECGECGYTREFTHKMCDKLTSDCPKCHKDVMSKKISAPIGIKVKGGTEKFHGGK